MGSHVQLRQFSNGPFCLHLHLPFLAADNKESSFVHSLNII